MCIFWKTKTDEFAAGTVCYLAVRDEVACPSRYLDVLEKLPVGSLICTVSESALNSRLRYLLKKIGVGDCESYSFHSFRRGGAFHASERGVQDAVIKAHGRWRSDAYLRYVRVDAVRAGRDVAAALQG